MLILLSLYSHIRQFKEDKHFQIRGAKETDFCDKNYDMHNAFCDGLMSEGCCCELAITYGQ